METNFEKRIMRLKDTLPSAPVGMTEWICNKIYYPAAFSSDGNICYCGKCGNRFHTTRKLEYQVKSYRDNPCQLCARKSCPHSGLREEGAGDRFECVTFHNIREDDYLTKCPVCNSKVRLKISDTSTIRQSVKAYAFCVHEGIQLLRLFQFDFTFTKGNPMNVEIKSPVTQWISEKGKVVTTKSCDQLLSSFNKDIFLFSKKIYPQYQFTPFLKKRGIGMLPESQIKDMMKCEVKLFRRKGGIIKVIKDLLRYPFVETLVKRGDFQMLYSLYSYKRRIIKTVIPSYFIALRHGYLPEDRKLWISMILIYKEVGKDIRNPHFICPTNLNEGYDKAMKILNQKEEKERKRREKECERYRQDKFLKFKGNFFNLEFGNDNLKIVSLNSISEYKEESQIMHNCVYSGGYYLDPDTLVLSVRKEGNRVADVEICLETFRILHCLGPGNEPVPYHEKIEALINENMTLIKERMNLKEAC